MKKLLLVLTMLVAFASVSMAGSRVPGGPQDQGDETSTSTQGVGQVIEPTPAPDMVVRPVPEPGTMALASMGLIALGAAARKRREK
ncbi:MAG: PEP-CTERM sorting domain-containing protein [Candidatus Eisenbacteria bacterium]|uniref:PEP-CTERM sorting domain-containing protein n=1 Tax=Eiseniibacteriota bacterium TaxID=2212470 RepID=A0A933W818_UNCEI|nr:PEP-CTERM sorting domain-containing protein [Candidatus Eisenbacteria bacterium]